MPDLDHQTIRILAAIERDARDERERPIAEDFDFSDDHKADDDRG